MSSNQPIFQSVFGKDWDRLPVVFKKHYANRPYTNDTVTVEGKMDIDYSKFMTCLLPLFKLFKVLVPYKGSDIPVVVKYQSETDSGNYYLNREFRFPEKPPYHFCSHLEVVAGDEVIEVMRFGIGWRMRYFYDGEKVILEHKGFAWQVFGIRIPLPLEIILGKGHAEEEVINDNTFRVTMTMIHAWFGQMYRYAGDFTFTSNV